MLLLHAIDASIEISMDNRQHFDINMREAVLYDCRKSFNPNESNIIV